MVSRYMELYQGYEEVSTLLASIYRIGESNQAIVSLSIRKAELELALCDIAEVEQTVTQTAVCWGDMWGEGS